MPGHVVDHQASCFFCAVLPECVEAYFVGEFPAITGDIQRGCVSESSHLGVVDVERQHTLDELQCGGELRGRKDDFEVSLPLELF